MAKRIVNKPFTLNQADGEKRSFDLGETVDGEVAEHWYVQAHSQPAEDAPADAPAEGDQAPSSDSIA